tara:strand:- start:30 stop:4058 length:4029 start_codon:yes stop_codon:yes gene_type:complete
MEITQEAIKLIYSEFSEQLKSNPNFDIPKNDIHEELLNYHHTELLKYDREDTRIIYLSNKLNQIEKELINTKTNIDRNIVEMHIDVLRLLIEDKMRDNMEEFDRDNFNYYPDIIDPYFNKKISEKAEFLNTKLPLILKTKSTSDDFRLSNAQRFAKNFISENTPYNGILLWHEVGVGKTCAGISIAENFRKKLNANNKKILILTPSETLQQNWSDEIFNIEKELHNRLSSESANVQCTGTTYSNRFNNLNEDNFVTIKRQSKKYINQFYQIISYNKLAKLTELNIKQQSWNKINKQKAIIDYIRAEYSNRLIIMDEVHVTREADDSSTHKLAVKYIELIARYAENTKIVLLTATPMYNISSEIVWLTNILLLNDKRAPIRESDIFERDGIRIKKDSHGSEEYAMNILINKTRGYISHVRGTNPLNFPIKLEPFNTEDLYTPSPTYQITAGKLENIDDTIDIPIQNMNFFRNYMSPWQWHNLKRKLLYKEGSAEGLSISSGFSQAPIRSSNIIFPSYMDINKEHPTRVEGLEGDPGFDGCFSYDKSDQKYIMSEFARLINTKNTKSFLHLKNIGQYSRKIANIVKSCKTNKGIGFVFSQYLKSGTTIIALALEQNGFRRYIGNDEEKNLLKPDLPLEERFCAKHLKHYSSLTAEEKTNFIQARYVLLDGSVSKSQLNNLVKECRGEGDDPNLSGEHIKIVIGSRVTEQGLSLHRVREVHIMDPWHHLNQMEQATGRAIRNKSHHKLPINQRNVTIHLHISALPKRVPSEDIGIETPDERIYRKAFNKKLNMAKIERLLKKNSIDCNFNKLGNIYLEEFYKDIDPKINPLKKQTIEDSKGNLISLTLYDKDGSVKCDFQKCNYNCFSHHNNDEDKYTTQVNTDTNTNAFSDYDVEFAEEHIINIFKENFAFYEEDIVNIVNEQFRNSDSKDVKNEIIYIALDNIVKSRTSVIDMYGRTGFIINRKNIYLFQPFELENTNIPMLYRYIPNLVIPDKTTLEAPITLKAKKKVIIKKKTVKGTSEKENIIISKWRNFKKYFNNFRLIKILLNNLIIVQLVNQKKDELIDKLINIQILLTFESNNSNNTNLNFTSLERTSILRYIIENKLNKVLLKEHEDIIDYEQLILDYYDKQEIFIIKNKDISEVGSPNEIIGFRTLIQKTPKIFKDLVYIFDKSAKKLKDMTPSYTDLFINESHMADNISNKYGWLESKKKKGETMPTTKLYIYYKKDGEVQKQGKKYSKKGGVCGASAGTRNITELINFIVELIIQNNDIFKGFFKKSDTLEQKSLEEKSTVIKKQLKLDKDKLCNEIQLILRFLNFYSEKIAKNNRTFYSYEERVIQKKILN